MYKRQIHIVDRYLETVKPLGIKNDGQGLDFFLDQDLLNPPECLRAGFQNLVNLNQNFRPLAPSRGEEATSISIREGKVLDYIALPIGAGRKTKALTISKIIHICQKINHPIVLLGGNQEIQKAEAIETIIKATEGIKNIVNLVGKCSLLELSLIHI